MAIFFFYLKYKIIQIIKMNTYKSYAKNVEKYMKIYEKNKKRRKMSRKVV